MKLYLCTKEKCGHEWYGSVFGSKHDKCDWCGAEGKVIDSNPQGLFAFDWNKVLKTISKKG